MTANKNLKKLIRLRMRRTGESYTAARRHFLRKEEVDMTEPNQIALEASIETLQLRLQTTRRLRSAGVTRIPELSERSDAELEALGLDRITRVEIREVLASRGY